MKNNVKRLVDASKTPAPEMAGPQVIPCSVPANTPGVHTYAGCAPGISGAELERIALLQKELGDVQATLGRILLHGYSKTWRSIEGGSASNKRTLEKTLGSALGILTLMERAGDVYLGAIEKSRSEHLERIRKHVHSQSGELITNAIRPLLIIEKR